MPVGIDVAGRQGVVIRRPVIQREPLRLGPPVGALVVLDDQFFGFAEIGEVRATIAIEVRHGQRGDPLLEAMESTRNRASEGSSLMSRRPILTGVTGALVLPVRL